MCGSVAILAQGYGILLSFGTLSACFFEAAMRARGTSTAGRGAAAVTVRQGNLVLHVHSMHDLEATLLALNSISTSEAAKEALSGALVELSGDTQRHISDGLGVHCSSLRDALFCLKKARPVSSSLGKRLCQLNATASLLRHYDEAWAKRLCSDVALALGSTPGAPGSVVLASTVLGGLDAEVLSSTGRTPGAPGSVVLASGVPGGFYTEVFTSTGQTPGAPGSEVLASTGLGGLEAEVLSSTGRTPGAPGAEVLASTVPGGFYTEEFTSAGRTPGAPGSEVLASTVFGGLDAEVLSPTGRTPGAPGSEVLASAVPGGFYTQVFTSTGRSSWRSRVRGIRNTAPGGLDAEALTSTGRTLGAPGSELASSTPPGSAEIELHPSGVSAIPLLAPSAALPRTGAVHSLDLAPTLPCLDRPGHRRADDTDIPEGVNCNLQLAAQHCLSLAPRPAISLRIPVLPPTEAPLLALQVQSLTARQPRSVASPTDLLVASNGWLELRTSTKLAWFFFRRSKRPTRHAVPQLTTNSLAPVPRQSTPHKTNLWADRTRVANLFGASSINPREKQLSLLGNLMKFPRNP